MPVSIAIIAPGAMGSAVAARLARNGARVLTLLDGRSERSRERAAQAGMKDSSPAGIAAADFILSIVPPAQALSLAQALAPHIAATAHKPVYIDCNALSPTTKQQVGDVLASAACPFIDGTIIGLPPRGDAPDPRFHLAGPDREKALPLADAGLNIRMIDGPVGAAAALKMCYAGINKGMTALGAAMILAAQREGAGSQLHQEMAESLPHVLTNYRRAIPDMYGKAYRWVDEMREIAAFLHEDEAAAMIFEGAARLYRRLADDVAGQGEERDMLSAFFAQDGDGR